MSNNPKGGMSYMSASDPRIHFGLGKRTKIESVEITWPSGLVEKLTNVPIDKIIAVKEGAGIVPRNFQGFPVNDKNRSNRRSSTMNLLRRRFLGSSLVVLGSSLLDALMTPLWKWRGSLRLEAAPFPNPSVSNSPATSSVQFVDVAREAGLLARMFGAASITKVHHRGERQRPRFF